MRGGGISYCSGWSGMLEQKAKKKYHLLTKHTRAWTNKSSGNMGVISFMLIKGWTQHLSGVKKKYVMHEPNFTFMCSQLQKKKNCLHCTHLFYYWQTSVFILFTQLNPSIFDIFILFISLRFAIFILFISAIFFLDIFFYFLYICTRDI